MAGSIPPIGHIPPEISISDPEIASSSSTELVSTDYVLPGTNPSTPSMLSSRSVEQKPEGYIAGGVMMLVMAMVFGAVGAPGFMILAVVVFALISFVMYFITKQQQVDRYYQEQMAAEEAEQHLKEQIAEAVKESLKGSIKVRCKYCGSLNEERNAKCDSCGAAL